MQTGTKSLQKLTWASHTMTMILIKVVPIKIIHTHPPKAQNLMKIPCSTHKMETLPPHLQKQNRNHINHTGHRKRLLRSEQHKKSHQPGRIILQKRHHHHLKNTKKWTTNLEADVNVSIHLTMRMTVIQPQTKPIQVQFVIHTHPGSRSNLLRTWALTLKNH